MVNGKTPIYVTVVVLVLLAAAVLGIQPYSADWPGTAYARPARRYIHAALQRDSAALVRISASPGPVGWALDVARRHPDSLARWRHFRTFMGERRGDTARVFLYAGSEGCDDAPIVLQLVDSGSRARVLRASSACFDAR